MRMRTYPSICGDYERTADWNFWNPCQAGSVLTEYYDAVHVSSDSVILIVWRYCVVVAASVVVVVVVVSSSTRRTGRWGRSSVCRRMRPLVALPGFGVGWHESTRKQFYRDDTQYYFVRNARNKQRQIPAHAVHRACARVKREKTSTASYELLKTTKYVACYQTLCGFGVDWKNEIVGGTLAPRGHRQTPRQNPLCARFLQVHDTDVCRVLLWGFLLFLSWGFCRTPKRSRAGKTEFF